VSTQPSLQSLIGKLPGYLFALLLVALATILRLLLNPVVGVRFPFAFFAAAVLLTTWIAGTGPGLLAVVVGAVVTDYLYILPVGSVGSRDPAGWIALGTYLVLSLGTVGVIAKYRSAMAVRIAIEGRLNDGLDAANAAIWDMNLKTGEEYWSASYYRMLGLEPSQALPTFDTWAERIHADDRTRVLKTWKAAIESRSSYSCQYRIVRPDGSVRWVEAKGKLTLDSGGNPIRSIGGFVDITDRKRAQVALIEAEKFAASGKMAASLAHEINNPLEAVSNLIYVMKNQPGGDAPTREYLQLAEDEIRRVARLVQKVLAVHRQPSPPVRADIGKMMTNLVALYQSRTDERGIRVDLQADNDAELLCNPEEVRQIVTNLLVNAIEAVTDRGRIIIRTRRSSEWGEPSRAGVRVTVADNGIGIPAAKKSDIFQPFVTSKGKQGTGLGLWISKGIVEKSGGSLRFRSRTRQPSGSCFSVFFPDADLSRTTQSAVSDRVSAS
jgi:PAS domain S-box-containing protein